MLDVYFLADYLSGSKAVPAQKDRIFSLDDFSLFKPGFEFLRSKTGVEIDEYGDTRLYPDHQRLLLDYWKDDLNLSVRKFAAFLTLAVNDNEVLLFIGD